jgi:hypothetical protein
VETNQFFIDLIAHARDRTGTRLARWWSATRTAAAFAGRIHPDGHGVWEADGGGVGCFLEYDRGAMFSGGRRSRLSSDLRVSAAQRLMCRHYRPRQVRCMRPGVCHLTGSRTVAMRLSSMGRLRSGAFEAGHD